MLSGILIFVFGTVVGVTATVALGVAVGSREMKKDRTKLLEELNKQKALLKNAAEIAAKVAPPPLPTSEQTVKERLHKAVQLTLKQNKLDTRVSDDDLILHNELELEKLIILRSILADGFDPPITVRFNSGDQEQLLSTYVANINKGLV